MMKIKNVATCIAAVAAQISLVSFAYAADLSEGMKGLKLGITKEEALKVLQVQELQKSEIYAPYCKPDALGEMCSTYISNLTYGNIPLLNWTIEFGPDGRLARVQLLLSKSGCIGRGMHPHSQFESLSALLERQYGKPNPTSRGRNGLVWLDREHKAGIVLGLHSQPIAGIGYPDCPITSVSLTSVDYMNKLNEPKLKGSTRQNDL